MRSVSWCEAGLVVGEPLCFRRGRKEGQVFDLDAETAANYATRCGHLPRLSMKRDGQLSQRLWTISAIALDKQGAMA